MLRVVASLGMTEVKSIIEEQGHVEVIMLVTLVSCDCLMLVSLLWGS